MGNKGLPDSVTKPHRSIVIVVAALIVAGSAAFFALRGLGPALPAPGSETYEQMTRAFYWGLSALEVGLLDDARQQFTKATTIVPEEPAAWANLGLAQLRLGELEAAAAPIDRALALAPDNGDVVLLAARMEAARGRLDEAVVRLRHAVELDPEGLRAKFALADELQRLNIRKQTPRRSRFWTTSPPRPHQPCRPGRTCPDRRAPR